jgi:6-phosphogluconate dehydrogenase
MKVMKEIGFIGLGRMGANMVRRLAAAGFRCVAFDANLAAVKALEGPVSRAPRRSRTSCQTHGAESDLAHAARGGRRPGTREPAAAARPATSSSMAAIPTIATTSPRGRVRRPASTTSTSAPVAASPAARTACLMIGGEKKIVDSLEPLFAALSPGDETSNPNLA